MPRNYTNRYASTGTIKTIRAYKNGEPVYQEVPRWRLVRQDFSNFHKYVSPNRFTSAKM